MALGVWGPRRLDAGVPSLPALLLPCIPACLRDVLVHTGGGGRWG